MEQQHRGPFCHRRLHSSSSALAALASLTPPSPILNPSQLSAAYTSGDIPILFDIPDIDIFTHTLGPGDSQASAAGLELGIPPSHSVESVDTVGTFGPVCKGGQLKRDSGFSPHASQVSWVSFGGFALGQSGVPVPSFPETQEGDCEGNHSDFVSLSQFTVSDRLPDVPKGDPSTDLDTHLCNGAYSPCDQFNFRPLSHRSSEYGNDNMAPCSTPPLTRREVPSSPSLPIPPIQLHFASPSRESYGHEDGGNVSLLQRNVRPTSFEPHMTTAPPLAPNPQVHPIHSPGRTERSDPDRRIAHQKSRHIARKNGKTALPKTAPWLHGIAVELLIDQEGFRAALPSFKFAGCSTSSSPPGMALDTDVAHFKPTKRQSFHFHHAPFDSPPTLRRITVNGDESRDYISRQAILSLKSNGVYTVQGAENSSLPTAPPDDATHGLDPHKLVWRFDYLVDDRRNDTSGKIVDGEKTLTPLTFSCSVTLLHPLHGKRVRLMHIVKKSVATKLVAEKMEPPASRPLNLAPNSPATAAPPKNQNAGHLVKTNLWNLHRRAQSHAPPLNDDKARPLESLDCLTGQLSATKEDEGSDPIGHASTEPASRRRRASSAGEWSARGSSHTTHRGPPTSAPQPSKFSSAKHIVPPSRLAELLAEVEENIPPVLSNSSGFQALAPGPRHYEARILARLGG